MAKDERPSVAVAHVALWVRNVARATQFYLGLGMRSVTELTEMAVLELRGGTHLLLFQAKEEPKPGPAGFDLLVDDVHRAREEAAARKLSPSPLKDGPGGHEYFELVDPDGYVVGIYSSHTEGRPV